MTRFLAFDLGAESGRALMGTLAGDRLALEPVHRFPNVPVDSDGTLRWNVEALWHELRRSLERIDCPLAAIGVDAWGCDYALVDPRGELVEPPWHYRDSRTDGVMDRVVAAIGRERIYTATGVQFLPFNSLYQLAAAVHRTPGTLERADRLLTMPDLFNFRLTGRMISEYTNATTTQCIDARTRTWAGSIIEAAGIPARIFGPVAEPGTIVGPARDVPGAAGVPVVAPACHDTGSAVAAVAAHGDTAFLSSGTWSLLGIELPAPVITPRALALNFTNEGGVCGTTRLLKNVAGLWLLQACRREWRRRDPDLSYDTLAAAAATAPPGGPMIDPDDPAFLHPASMTQAIADSCRDSGQPVPDGPAVFTRTILESLALKYRVVLDWLEDVADVRIRTIRIIGGGSRNALLNQLTADATGRQVCAGPVEATALGNIAMQMLATGAVATLDESRAIIAHSFPAQRFDPADSGRWDSRVRTFRDLCQPGARTRPGPAPALE